MTVWELVGAILLVALLFVIAAVGDSIRRRSDNAPDPELDARLLAKIDAEQED